MVGVADQVIEHDDVTGLVGQMLSAFNAVTGDVEYAFEALVAPVADGFRGFIDRRLGHRLAFQRRWLQQLTATELRHA